MIRYLHRIAQFLPTRLDVLTLCLIAGVWIGAPVHAQMQRDTDLREAVGASIEQIAAAIPEQAIAEPTIRDSRSVPIPKHKPPVSVQLAQR